MIPSEYPKTYSGLLAFNALIRDSDEDFEILYDYNNAKTEDEMQAVIAKYQLSPEQVQVIKAYNKATDALFAYEKSLEAGKPIDLSQLGLSDIEVEIIKEEAREGIAGVAILRFSRDKKLKHLAHFFALFPEAEEIVLESPAIRFSRSDVMK